MNKEEFKQIVEQLKEILKKYPNKQLEILEYIFGKETLKKIASEPTYKELRQENTNLKQALKEIREYIKCKQKEQYKYALSHIECDDISQIIDKVGGNE